jgi:Dyp-type peroxidase family
MTDLQKLLDEPIRWNDWTKDGDLLSLLADLQANILKGHGRDHTKNIFLSFDGMAQAAIAALLRDLSFVTTSALEQLREAEAFSAAKVSGGTVICVMLSAGGYSKLGIAGSNIPGDHAFRAGMKARGQLEAMTFSTIPGKFPPINDPERQNWEKGEAWDPDKAAPDAMVLVADDDGTLVEDCVDKLTEVFGDRGATVLGTDTGLAQRRLQPGGDKKGEGIEHFGYVDGRSQPLFLAEDLEDDDGNPKPPGAWIEKFKPSQFIVPDPGNPTTFSCGSYFVYRKLEQNVKLFKQQESDLADALGLVGDERERAGALVVGRFEDGTPVRLSAAPMTGTAPTNDFDYQGADGMNCPFRAHIRKTNPRTPGSQFERSRIMARRGITYGKRATRPKGADFNKDDRPTNGVGLIFMAYMADINEQFEFTQSAWANNPDFPATDTGIDVVIGQPQHPPTGAQSQWPDNWQVPPKVATFDFQQSVTLMGGEYFFAPSISFLQSAGQFVAPALIA